MASKSVFQDFNADALNYFDLEGGTYYGALSGSNVINKVKLLKSSAHKDVYEKICKTLKTPSKGAINIKSKKKAFVLPNCKVSQDKIKSVLNEHNIKLTNDYNLADLIICHEDITKGSLSSGENIPTTLMINRLWNYETSENYEFSVQLTGDLSLEIIRTEKVHKLLKLGFNPDSNYHTSIVYVTGMALNLAHKINVDKMDVMDVDTLLNSSASKFILTESLLYDIKNQLDSSDMEVRNMVPAILCSIDYTKNLHLLWRLAHEGTRLFYNDSYKRNKDLKNWLDKSQLYNFKNYTAHNMLAYLERNNLLNSEYFQFFEPKIRKNIRIINRDFYTFKVSVKEEYKKYLK